MNDNKINGLVARHNALTKEDKAFVYSMYELAISLSEFHERFELFRHRLMIPPESVASHGEGLVHRPTMTVEEQVAHMVKRLPFLVEEIGEHAKELNGNNFELAIDEMIDVVYIAMGTLYTAGETSDAWCASVALKNDRKTLKTHYVSDTGKVVKREG